MSGTWGRNLRLTIFGESHGGGIGMVVDGIPAGMPVDEAAIARDMARRAPGNDPTATARKEADAVRILSGVYRGFTTGAPLCGVIENTNTRSQDYENIARVARPGHADYTGFVRFGGFNDPRGGGHFSGRLTAPLVFAGALARQWLGRKGVEVGAHIASIGSVADDRFDPCAVTGEQIRALQKMRFPLLDHEQEAPMRAEVDAARRELDSVGALVECAAVGLPAGWGDPFFESVEGTIASLLFSVPAVKGVEFGTGFGLCSMRGSEANDPMRAENGKVTSLSNHNGGILGGITNGMPLIVRAAIKPTASIAQCQQSVELLTGENADLEVRGRHDPCIALRAVPVIEAAVMLGLMERALEVEA